MKYGVFGTIQNDDGTPIDNPLAGTFVDSANSVNNFGSGGTIQGTNNLSGKLQLLDTSGNVVILFDPNG